MEGKGRAMAAQMGALSQEVGLGLQILAIHDLQSNNLSAVHIHIDKLCFCYTLLLHQQNIHRGSFWE